MLGIDKNSFIIISAAFGLLCGFLFFALRVGFPKSIAGLGEWGWGCLLMVVAAVGFTMRGKLPVFFYSYLPNLLVPAGVIAMHRSLRLFGQMVPRERPLVALLAVMALSLGWATFVEDDYRLRVLIVSGVLTILFAACGHVITRYRSTWFAERFTCAVYVATAVVMAARCVAVLSEPALTVQNDTSALHYIYFAAFPFSLVAMSLGFLLMANRALQLRLETQAQHDSMSNTLRRDAFMERVAQEVAAARRQGSSMALLMMDLDNFKAINDTRGHPVGDQVIVDFANHARQALRAQDAIGRYGGEEFVVLLPRTGIDAALAIAEQIRRRVADAIVPALPRYTVSIGVASSALGAMETGALFDAADKALYAAKRAGKNRVIAAAAAPGRALDAA
jgi:diguanylate cyclase (GGDEF)-like protein